MPGASGGNEKRSDRVQPRERSSPGADGVWGAAPSDDHEGSEATEHDAVRRVAAAARRHLDLILPALLAYVPLLATSPGWVGADTKSYLYVDPDELLAGAASLWQPDTGLGTVTHQNIGYLWPMGPFFWVFEHLGIPDWVAQRIWLATILVAAAWGVRYLLRTLGWSGSGLLVASLAYMCSPYMLHYSARISVLLLPWAALPWMIALAERSVRSRGWRHPALFGLTVTTAGSVNATSLLLVGLAPVLWLVHACLVARTASWRHAAGAALRIGVASVGCSLWWIAGLVAQSGYSLPVTRYTETYEVIADASSAPEVMRGLGYWFFYGRDTFGPWVRPSEDYTNHLWLLALSFAIPVVAVVGAAFTRWAHRSFFFLLAGFGALVSVAGHPFDDPSQLGQIFSDFTQTDAGLALRSTPRAVPMVALATAVMLGMTVNAFSRTRPRPGMVTRVVAGVAVVANLPALWSLQLVEPYLRFPEEIPSYWRDAAALLDGQDDRGRVLEIPGSDFGTYRWGNTVDPILSGLIDRPVAARELVPFGSGASAALLGAFDRTLQQGTFDPDSLAPIARLLGVGDVVYRADLEFERYRSPRPQPTWAQLLQADGFDAPIEFGADEPPNVAGPEEPLIDELALNASAQGDHPPAVAVLPVTDRRPLVTTVAAASPTIVVGDPSGVVDAAGAGVLPLDAAVLFATSVVADPELLATVAAGDQHIIVTDSHRKQAQRWGAIREVYGVTEVAGAEPVDYDPNDNRLPVFGEIDDISDDDRTVAEHRGVTEVAASEYGSRVSYTPEDRPVLALDGDPDTAWTVGGFGEPRGERLRVLLDEPVMIDHVDLLQVQRPANRFITEVALRFDGGDGLHVALDDTSRTSPGQRIEFSTRAVEHLEIEILATNVAPRPTYFGISAVGLAEVGIADIVVDEVIRLPIAWADHLGHDPATTTLDVVLTRERTDPREPARSDPERSIVRAVTLPASYDVAVAGDVRLSSRADDSTLAELAGWDVTIDGEALTTTSSGRLPGDPLALAAAAFDDNPATSWTSTFSPAPGAFVSATRVAPRVVSSVSVTLDTGPRRSVPSRLGLSIDGVAVASVAVVVDPAGATTTSVDIPVEPTRGRSIQLTVEEIIPRLTPNWYTGESHALPVSVIDVSVDGFVLADPPVSIDTRCRDGLLVVDGRPVAVRVRGRVDDALASLPLALSACGTVELGRGETVVRAAPGRTTGLDVDRLVMSHEPTSAGNETVEPPARSPTNVLDDGRTSMSVGIERPTELTWLVLGQSHNAGWEARVRGGENLGSPTLIDGYANGWLIDPDQLPAGDVVIDLEWTPQRVVRRSIAVSLVAIAACIVLAWRGRRFKPGPATAAERLYVRRGRWNHEPVPPLRLALITGGAVAFTLLNLPDAPLWALGVGAAVAVPLRKGGDLPIPGLVGGGLLALTALFHVGQQWRHGYPADFNWPILFERVHVIGVVAVCCLIGEVARAAAAERAGPRHRRPVRSSE